MAEKCDVGKKDIVKIVGVFFAGSVAGALAGLLLAPKSGAETRQKIKKASSDAGGKVKEKFGEAKSGVVNLFSRGKEKVEDVKTEIQDKIQDTVEAGKEVYKKKKKELDSEA
jgi:gas vesicle protein